MSLKNAQSARHYKFYWATGLHSGGVRLELWPRHLLCLVYCSFPQSFQANTAVAPINAEEPLPSTPLPIHCSVAHHWTLHTVTYQWRCRARQQQQQQQQQQPASSKHINTETCQAHRQADSRRGRLAKSVKFEGKNIKFNSCTVCTNLKWQLADRWFAEMAEKLLLLCEGKVSKCAVSHSAAVYSVTQCSCVQCHTVPLCELSRIAVMYSVIQCGCVQCHTVLLCTVSRSAAVYSVIVLLCTRPQKEWLTN